MSLDYNFINKQIERINIEKGKLRKYLSENNNWEDATLEELRDYVAKTGPHSEKQFVFKRIIELTEKTK